MLTQPTDPQQEETTVRRLPWRLNGNWTGFIDSTGAVVLWDKLLTVGDAEFILHAVNDIQQLRERHEAITAALKEIVEDGERHSAGPFSSVRVTFIRAGRAALAKAWA